MRTTGCSSKNTLMNDFPWVRFFNNYYIPALSIWRCLSEKLDLVKKAWTNIFSFRSGQGVINHLTAEKIQPGWEVCKDNLIFFFFFSLLNCSEERGVTHHMKSLDYSLFPLRKFSFHISSDHWTMNHPGKQGREGGFSSLLLTAHFKQKSHFQQSNWSFIKWKEEEQSDK